MQLQFLAPVELFFKQLNGCSFSPGRNHYFLTHSFSRCVRSVHTVGGKETFNHCGRSKGLEQHTSWKVRVPDCVFFVKKDKKVYPVGTVQVIRHRAELGRQSARQVGIAGFSLSFCAQCFQRKRCQPFDRSMPTFGPGSFFAAVWALTSVLPWSLVQRDPFPSVTLVESLPLRVQWTRTFGLPGGSFELDWLGELCGGRPGRRRWRGGTHLWPLRGGRPLGSSPMLPAGAAWLVGPLA